MEVLVNGVKKELVVKASSGIEYTEDFIGNMGDLKRNDDEEYVMDQETFEFWQEACQLENENNSLESDLTEDQVQEINAQCGDQDFMDELRERNRLLKEAE